MQNVVRAQLLGEDATVCSAEEDGIEDDFCDDAFLSTSEPTSEALNQSTIPSHPGSSHMSVPSSSTYEYVVMIYCMPM